MVPRRRTVLAALVTLACAGPAAACGDASGGRAAFDAWRPGDPVPDVALVDQDGRAFRLAQMDGAHVVLGFVFTRCAVPTACPAVMAKLRAIDEATEDRVVRVVAVTLDPAHDDPAALKAYAAKHGAAFTLATGAPGIVDDALPSLWNIVALRRGGTIDHGVKIALLGPDRRPIAEWGADVGADEVLQKVATWNR